MWVLTPEGFFSTTQSKVDPDAIQVRARRKEHLMFLLSRLREDPSKHKIHEDPKRDYKYRIYVTRQQFKEWMSTVVDTLDYDNFKNEAHYVQAQNTDDDSYVQLLHEIWHMGFSALGENWSEYNNI
tara:strand:- start:239 stop:616 length:378 start_codon:yes stop_codon:yes gene_type:complete